MGANCSTLSSRSLKDLIKQKRWDHVIERIGTERGKNELRNAGSWDGILPLHCACWWAPPWVVEVVLKGYPEAARTTDLRGSLPLHVACSRRPTSSEVVKLILDAYRDGAREASVKSCSSGYGNPREYNLPIHLFDRVGSPEDEADVETIEILLREIMLDEEKCQVEDTLLDMLPLHVAARFAVSIDILKALLETYKEAAKAQCKRISNENKKTSFALDLLEMQRPKSGGDDKTDNFDNKSDLLFAGNPDVPRQIKFWIRDDSKCDAGKPYRVIPKFYRCPDTEKPWWKKNPSFGVEICCFLIVFGIGVWVILVAPNPPDPTFKQLFGISFFDAFVVAGYNIIMEWISKGVLRIADREAWTYLKPTSTKETCASFLLVVTYSVLALGLDYEVFTFAMNWGVILVSTGMIELSQRFFFYLPRPEDEVRRLEEEVKALKNTVGLGLADGYFFNFLEYVLKDLQFVLKSKDRTHNPIYLYNKKKVIVRIWDKPLVPFFVVAIPWRVKGKTDCPPGLLKDLRGKHEAGTDIKDCAIVCEDSPDDDFRPRMLLLHEHTCTDVHEGFMFDVPTTLDSMIRSIVNNPEIDLGVEWQQEITIFTWRLAWWLRKTGLDHFVRIIEVEFKDNTDFMKVLSGAVADEWKAMKK